MVFDVRSKTNKPIYQSTIKSGKHTDPVWQVKWQEMDLAKELAFFSVSTDGLVSSWTLSKNELTMETVMRLPFGRCRSLVCTKTVLSAVGNMAGLIRLLEQCDNPGAG